MSSRLVRVREAAERLGCSRSTVHRWRRLGLMPPGRLTPLGKSICWTDDEFDAFLRTLPGAPQSRGSGRSGSNAAARHGAAPASAPAGRRFHTTKELN